MCYRVHPNQLVFQNMSWVSFVILSCDSCIHHIVGRSTITCMRTITCMQVNVGWSLPKRDEILSKQLKYACCVQNLDWAGHWRAADLFSRDHCWHIVTTWTIPNSDIQRQVNDFNALPIKKSFLAMLVVTSFIQVLVHAKTFKNTCSWTHGIANHVLMARSDALSPIALWMLCFLGWRGLRIDVGFC